MDDRIDEREESNKGDEKKKMEKDIDVTEYYFLEAISTKHVKKHKTIAMDCRLRLCNLDKLALDVKNMTLPIHPNGMVKNILQPAGLDKPTTLPIINKDDLTMDLFMTQVEHMLHSKKDVKLDSYMNINFVHMEMPEGGI